MKVAGALYCDRCGDAIPAYDSYTGHSEVYITWSHPDHGGGSMVYCTDPVRECAARMLWSLGVGVKPDGAPNPDAPEEILVLKGRQDLKLDWPVDLIEFTPLRKLPLPDHLRVDIGLVTQAVLHIEDNSGDGDHGGDVQPERGRDHQGAGGDDSEPAPGASDPAEPVEGR